MKKKGKFLNVFRPLKRMKRESSLKILLTEKEMNKKRNVSIDFSTSPFKNMKKIVKRNVRKNSFNKLLFNQTEEINNSILGNLSYIPSSNLMLNKKFLLNNNINTNNKNFPFKKKIYNKLLYFNIENNNKIINKTKTSIGKKNSKIFRINTHSFIGAEDKIQTKFKVIDSFKINNNNNNSNAYKKNKIYHTNANSFIKNKKSLGTKKDKLINKEKLIPIKSILLKNKKKLKINGNLNDNKKINKKSKYSKKNLSINFKKSTDFLIIKKSKKYNINNIQATTTPSFKERSHSLAVNNQDLDLSFDKGNINLLYENIKLKKKNEELISKINHISKEFNEIKKDNNDIKEELKEKNNLLSNIKLTMDIFNQELIRLQNQIVINNNNKINNFERNKNINIKGIENNENYEKTPSTCLDFACDKKNISNEKKLLIILKFQKILV